MEWISVKDGLPPEIERVLVCCESSDGGFIRDAYRKGEQWMRAFREPVVWNVTHWMPLPQPPKEVRDDDHRKRARWCIHCEGLSDHTSETCYYRPAKKGGE